MNFDRRMGGPGTDNRWNPFDLLPGETPDQYYQRKRMEMAGRAPDQMPFRPPWAKPPQGPVDPGFTPPWIGPNDGMPWMPPVPPKKRPPNFGNINDFADTNPNGDFIGGTPPMPPQGPFDRRPGLVGGPHDGPEGGTDTGPYTGGRGGPIPWMPGLGGPAYRGGNWSGGMPPMPFSNFMRNRGF